MTIALDCIAQMLREIQVSTRETQSNARDSPRFELNPTNGTSQ